MTPVQTIITKVEDMIFANPTTSSEQLQFVRTIAEMLIAEELRMLEDAYYEGYAAGKKNESDIISFIEKFKSINW